MRLLHTRHPRPSHPSHPRRSLLAPAALLVCLSATLAACSDDADTDPGSGDGAGASAGGAEGAETAADGPPASETRRCRVVVEATGDAEASWEGRGEVRLSSDEAPEDGAAGQEAAAATYSASKGGNLVRVYSADADIDYPSVTFSQGQLAFTSLEGDADDVEVATDGSGAESVLTLQGLDDTTIDLDVAFTCGEGGRGGRGGRGGGQDRGED